VEVLVSAEVLEIKEVLPIVRPEVGADAAMGVVRDLGVVGLPMVRTQTFMTPLSDGAM